MVDKAVALDILKGKKLELNRIHNVAWENIKERRGRK
jgi:hypothetical protein